MIKWNWRLASRLSVIVLAILVVLVVVIVQQQRAGASLHGTQLDKRPAQNFSLTDQHGKKVSLNEFKGKPVVVTFLFTNCPDICPLTAEYLRASLDELGDDASKVAVLAVSTDPKRDDVAAALKFSQNHRLADNTSWHFLVGAKEELAPIWAGYGVHVQHQQETVNHTAAIYMLDKEGRQRVFIGEDFTPQQVTQNLQALLNE